MKQPQQVGLIVEGNSTKSIVLRLPNLGAQLGPVKSSALRVARRVTNFLQAGFAVTQYTDLQDTRMVLIRAPDESVPRIVQELSASGLSLQGLIFVLCESWLLSDILQPLEEKGSAIATLVSLSGRLRPWFLIEGSAIAVRHIRRLLEASGAKGLELRRETKQLYFAANLLSEAIPVPLLIMAQQALRKTGMSGKNLDAVIQQMTGRMISNFLRGGRPAWGGPLTECSPTVADSLFSALRQRNPEVASMVDEQFAWALKQMSKRVDHS